MGRKCSVCLHPKLDRIEIELVSGVPFRRIATHLDLSESSLRRHTKNHLPEHLLKAREEQEIFNADNLIAKMAFLWSDNIRIKNILEEQGDYRGVLQANKTNSKLIDTQLRLRSQQRKEYEDQLLPASEVVHGLRLIIERALKFITIPEDRIK